jgi:hypothetical protein
MDGDNPDVPKVGKGEDGAQSKSNNTSKKPQKTGVKSGTRSCTQIQLIDQPLEQILGAKLPNNLSVLRHFFHHR